MAIVESSVPVFLLTTIVVVTAAVAYLVQNVLPQPYMDEIFHLPQARQYCDGNWTQWDPMITTLPGLYLASITMLWPLSSLTGTRLLNLCTFENLRGCNIVFTAGNFVLLYLLTCKLHENVQGRSSGVRKALNACVLTLFPVAYFFSWLYYTDPGSTFFTLLMYLLFLYDKPLSTTVVGAAAVVFRQTNIIWLLFCVALKTAGLLEAHVIKSNKGMKARLNDMRDFEVFKLVLKSLVSSPRSTFCFLFDVFCGTFWYLCLTLGFAGFVYINQGIVVGDRSSHTVSVNFPQIFYFLMITAVFSFIHLISWKQIKQFLSTMLKNPVKLVLSIAIACYLIKHFTYEHKFTLSDNRHYTFYVWSKVFRRHHLVRYAMISVYLYTLFQLYTLTVSRGFLWRFSLCVCLFILLVPHSLLEFRYFILPFYIVRLNMKLPSTLTLFLELLYYVAVNAFTVYMFVYKPFFWPSDSSPQRFMW